MTDGLFSQEHGGTAVSSGRMERERLHCRAVADLKSWSHGGGFSVHAGVLIDADDRSGLERLLRYCARPAFASERLEWESTIQGSGEGEGSKARQRGECRGDRGGPSTSPAAVPRRSGPG